MLLSLYSGMINQSACISSEATESNTNVLIDLCYLFYTRWLLFSNETMMDRLAYCTMNTYMIKKKKKTLTNKGEVTRFSTAITTP